MKILYNVTVKIESAIHDEWLDWMRSVHIPDVMATGCFLSYRITRIVGDNDEHGIGYAFQYISPDNDTFHRYNTLYAPALQRSHTERYKEQYVAFRTLMEVIEEG
ncbi:MAG: DUF4286 family protein [Saprospiraceae bacterium]|nr:DUF4286 family protein [Saprospiraceae bacterium]